jgi:hypothetical protein
MTRQNGDHMFCPTCGFEYTQKTNYCKRCGAELNAAPQSVEIKTQRSQATGMAFVVVGFLGIAGLFLNLFSFHALLGNHVDPKDAILSFALVLLSVGGIVGFLIKQMSRLSTSNQKSNQAPEQERIIAREAQAPQIGAPAGPVWGGAEPHSVVEHTTRQMAGVYNEPKATK